MFKKKRGEIFQGRKLKHTKGEEKRQSEKMKEF